MRLDKFLKVSRLIKRRTVAKDVSDQGRVLLNGREAKPSATVKVGDELEVQFGQRTLPCGSNGSRNRPAKKTSRGWYSVLKEEVRKREPDPFGL